MKTDIIAATPEQVPVLGSLARKIFYDTFKDANSPENMEHYLTTGLNDESFAQQLLSDKYHTFLVWLGDSEPRLVGYIQFYFNPTETYEDITLELKRFYVDPEFHGQGLAGMMMEFCLRKAQDLGQKRIWLGVWENNLRAQNFYKKWGFKEIDEHPFVTGTEVQRDLIFACEVKLPT